MFETRPNALYKKNITGATITNLRGEISCSLSRHQNVNYCPMLSFSWLHFSLNSVNFHSSCSQYCYVELIKSNVLVPKIKFFSLRWPCAWKWKHISMSSSNYTQLLIISFMCHNGGGKNFLINSLLTFFSPQTCLIKLTDMSTWHSLFSRCLIVSIPLLNHKNCS